MYNDLNEQELIDIALTSPEVQKLLDDYHVYEPSVAWAYTSWHGTKMLGWYVMSEKKPIGDTVLDPPGGYPGTHSYSNVEHEEKVYRAVELRFGDPPKHYFSAAIDTESREILRTMSYPLEFPWDKE